MNQYGVAERGAENVDEEDEVDETSESFIVAVHCQLTVGKAIPFKGCVELGSKWSTRQELLTKLTKQAKMSWKKDSDRPEALKAPGMAITAAPAVAFRRLKIVDLTPPGLVKA